MSIRETPRERLAQRLRNEGHDVDAHRITNAVGWYRINQCYDDTIVTWEVFDGNVWLWSYDTITNCARRGITLGERDMLHIQVFAKDQAIALPATGSGSPAASEFPR